MRRFLFVLISFVDAAIALVLLNTLVLLLSKGGLGEWYAHWAETIISIYTIAGFLYIAAVIVFGALLFREIHLSASRKALWLLAGVFIGYLAIPMYLWRHRHPPHA
jgi:hypothetical protein